MALSADTIWEIQTTGDDNNGGGFVSGASGTDYTQGVGQTVISWLASGGTYTNNLSITNADPSVVSSASRNFVAADVGNIIHLTAGTNVTAGWYEIVSVASNQATLDRNAMSGAGSADGSGYLGGALASIGGLGLIWTTAAQATEGMKAYVKGGEYTLTNTTANTSGGPLDVDAGELDNKTMLLKGYAADAVSRDDFTGTRPIIDCEGQACSAVIKFTGSLAHNQVVAFFDIVGDADNRPDYGIYCGNDDYDVVDRCIVRNTVTGIYQGTCDGCLVVGTSDTGFYYSAAHGCIARETGGRGFQYCTACVNCIADNCSSSGWYFSNGIAVNCVSYDNDSTGFLDLGDRSPVLINCLSVGDGNVGYNCGPSAVLINCGHYSPSYDRLSGTDAPLIDDNPITLTADPFTDAANGDFSLNNDPGGGALCRAAGLGPYGQTSYRDVGAVQHADPAASSGGGTPVFGGMVQRRA